MTSAAGRCGNGTGRADDNERRTPVVTAKCRGNETISTADDGAKNGTFHLGPRQDAPEGNHARDVHLGEVRRNPVTDRVEFYFSSCDARPVRRG